MHGRCVFADEGVKGWDLSRPALDRLKSLVESGVVKRTDLYIFDTSRLFRDVGLASELRRFFDVHNVRVLYVADGLVSGCEDHKLIYEVKALFNENFCDSLGRNVSSPRRC